MIQTNYIDGRKLDYNLVFKSSITGMLKVLDPHSTYFDPIDFAAFKTEQRSEYFGIGATIDHMHQGDQVNTYIALRLTNHRRRARVCALAIAS